MMLLELTPALSSLPQLLETVQKATAGHPRSKKIMLACEEAFVNIVNYSGAREMAVSLQKAGDRLIVTFSDNGIPFDPVSAKSGEKPFEETDDGGMGITLIKRLADSVRYNRTGTENVLSLIFVLGENECWR